MTGMTGTEWEQWVVLECGQGDDYVDETWDITTMDQIEATQARMRELEIESTPVWVGEPRSPDAVKNGQTLYAGEAAI